VISFLISNTHATNVNKKLLAQKLGEWWLGL